MISVFRAQNVPMSLKTLAMSLETKHGRRQDLILTSHSNVKNTARELETIEHLLSHSPSMSKTSHRILG